MVRSGSRDTDLNYRSLQYAYLLLLLTAASLSAQVEQPSEKPRTELLNPRPTEVRDRELGRDMLPFELTRAAEKLVDVTREEKDRFAEERRSGGSKILKLYSAPGCASVRLVVDVGKSECAAAVDFIRASFYSFRLGLYGESAMDVRILEDRLIAGNGGFVHGLVVDLGKAEPGLLNAKHEQVRALSEMPIAKTLDEESKQRDGFEAGIQVGGLRASSAVKLAEGSVYLVRIVSYGSKRDDRANFNNGFNRLTLSRDQVFVIKFAGINKDNVAILLWKKVSDRPAPKL